MLRPKTVKKSNAELVFQNGFKCGGTSQSPLNAAFKSRHHGNSHSVLCPGWPASSCMRSTTCCAAPQRSSARIESNWYCLASERQVLGPGGVGNGGFIGRP